MGSEVIIVPVLFLSIVYVFYVIANGFNRRQQLRVTAEFQGKLLERMGTVGEFSQFLGTEGGQRFLAAISTEPTGGLAHQRVLRAFQSGIVMVCLGIGIFLYLGEINPRRETYEVIGLVGTVSTAVGFGLLISGYVSLRLSRRMGLINGKPPVPAAHDTARA